MTPEYIASRLAVLPQFEVESLDHRTGKDGRVTILKGDFSRPVGDEAWSAYLFLPDLRYLDGSLLAAKDGGYIRSIEVGGYSWSDVSEQSVRGSKLAFFNYDLRRLKLVIDPAIQWEKVEFHVTKAVQSYIIGTDGKSYRRLVEYVEGTALLDGETIIEGAWDHEHCIFCWRKIDSENLGFKSDDKSDGEWACEWCYRHAVEKNDPRPLLIPYVDRDF